MDINLYFEESGAGTPFVLLHGNGENGTYFRNQIEYFSKVYRVIAVDTRGHGKSPRGGAPFTIEQFAEDLNFFFECNEIQRAVLLGFSDGANIAMRFALKYGSKLSALILNGGNLNPSGVKHSVQIPIEIGYRVALRSAHKSPEAERKAELLGLMVNEPNTDKSELAAITVPTLVIAGTRDMIKKKHTQTIADGISGAELRLIDGDHFIAAKNPAGFNLAVEDFLKRHGV